MMSTAAATSRDGGALRRMNKMERTISQLEKSLTLLRAEFDELRQQFPQQNPGTPAPPKTSNRGTVHANQPVSNANVSPPAVLEETNKSGETKRNQKKKNTPENRKKEGVSSSPTKLMALDVECFANGRKHTDRAPCWVALVDEECNTVYEAAIRVPTNMITSYLTPITGITEESYLAKKPKPFSQVKAELVALLGSQAILVGQSIDHDIEWMQLSEGVDFHSAHDIAEDFAFTKKGADGDRKIYSSLEHTANTLLSDEERSNDHHTAVGDCLNTMQLFKKFSGVTTTEKRQHAKALRQAIHMLRQTKPPPRSIPPTIDDVCTSSSAKYCTCGGAA